ncbi:hypothetical protein HPP92_006751 [Vanilla planifolia]|uniref:Uncharacterized protein n=1 Tax=Vanilla planifolia TaxID=51239 RepID=A0A835R978_VANPL|nr:hypothetical protein HPP92_006751 [Vanilla planifolia]
MQGAWQDATAAREVGSEQSQVQSYGEQITELLETEKNLRLKLAADGEKFQQFQDVPLMKSNEVLKHSNRRWKGTPEKQVEKAKPKGKAESLCRSYRLRGK